MLECNYFHLALNRDNNLEKLRLLGSFFLFRHNLAKFSFAALLNRIRQSRPRDIKYPSIERVI